MNRRTAGFSVVDLIATLGIGTILAVLAIPNLTDGYRRFALGAEGQKLYAAMLTAQGEAMATGTSHCVAFSRAQPSWVVRRDQNQDGLCNTEDRTVADNGARESHGWPEHVRFGPKAGIAQGLPHPYEQVVTDSWCTGCSVTDTGGALFFDGEGRVCDNEGSAVDSGAVMLHDRTGSSEGRVEVVVFIGPTGDLRLFHSTE